MIIMGGYFANTSNTQCHVVDEKGQAGLLLGQESEEVDPEKTHWWWRLWPEYNRYRVPDKITSLIGGKYVPPCIGFIF
jgi:hypothetical protein